MSADEYEELVDRYRERFGEEPPWMMLVDMEQEEKEELISRALLAEVPISRLLRLPKGALV